MFDETQYEYVGSWARVGATLIDSMLALFLMAPLLTMIYGRAYWDNERLVVGPADFFISWVLPAVAVIAFWLARGATPGKMAVSAQVVDARTGAKPSVGQSIGRMPAITSRRFESARACCGSASTPKNRDGATSWPAPSSCVAGKPRYRRTALHRMYEKFNGTSARREKE